MQNETKEGIIVGGSIFTVIVIFICLCMWSYPKYNVYSQRMEGQAILAHAQSSREVAVCEAKAKMESATLLAEAEVLRAGGVAKANKIIGESLKNHEEYLRYLWITQLEKSTHETIYVPTEANMPIMEANRRLNR